tara:strand:+ start:742 stop:1464 length:723 start_codon:yes stop_codon:yes gene_type:complete
MNLKDQIREALGLSKEIKLEAQAKLADGTIVVSDTDFVAGANIMILAEDGTTMPLPVGDYELEDGTIISVAEEGVISEVSEGEEEEVDAGKEKDEYEEEEAPAEDEAEEAVTEVVEEVVSATEEIAEAINEATPDEVTPEIAQQAAEIAVAVVEEKAEEVALSKEMRTVLSIIRKELDAIKKPTKVKSVKKNFTKAKPAAKPVQSKKFSSKKRKSAMQELSSTEYKALTTKERYLFNLGK